MFEVALELSNGESIFKLYDSLDDVKEALNTLTQSFFLENVIKCSISPVVKFDIQLTLPKDKANKLSAVLEEL